ncbi:50S ribosomal protein L13 [Spiroplasma endosymbiont of Amphibalanus improvisus]|uniref:50S ribosomal protein L13 n=1 Tax=Spiroplasma endosymbiont of Amphibalanus improvisus TaxID=3066327 RepID=UPI00313E015D
MRQTTILKNEEIKKEWFLIDATDLTLGRMASKVALILKGKNKANYTPHLDCGDNVIIINADKINLSGNKYNDKKYYSHSQYPGGLKITKAKDMLRKKPIYPVERAVRLMLPKGILGRKIFKNLFVYSDDKHPHEAQQPKKIIITEAQKGDN